MTKVKEIPKADLAEFEEFKKAKEAKKAQEAEKAADKKAIEKCNAALQKLLDKEDMVLLPNLEEMNQAVAQLGNILSEKLVGQLREILGKVQVVTIPKKYLQKPDPKA